MLSVLIPTYNYNISELINSLVKQLIETSIPFEIIFCEDSSTRYVDENLLLSKITNVLRLENAENLGRTATRLKLSDAASFKWVLFLDADVLIKDNKFISRYLQSISKDTDIVFGGTSYSKSKKNDSTLRWKFGTYRESKKASIRGKNPNFIISQNLLIRKSVVSELNSINSKRYGLDNVLSYQIYKKAFNIHHIDNPVVHCGLESNAQFLKKSLNAIETLIYFEKEKKISEDFTRLQKAYISLEKNGLLQIAKFSIKIGKTSIKKNLLSNNPSLFLYDLYRLYHYITLKENA